MIATAFCVGLFVTILIISLGTVALGIRSNKTLWLRAYGIDSPRSAHLPPPCATTACSVTVLRDEAATPSADEQAEIGSAAA
ncbi:hypothetical protein [Sphingomonas crocodyli]|uniref:Uncharacterized protein n=1 Tax=Sphingomonas crocodyli TaxID=1979270 RepID=A0A437M7R9_9SPHN|nr:hypothetical protein [Sphingomonas crocodyli]RVT93732.1 hypothetical protein EOD43_07655 [Sphingomonas crocodyli]